MTKPKALTYQKEPCHDEHESWVITSPLVFGFCMHRIME